MVRASSIARAGNANLTPHSSVGGKPRCARSAVERRTHSLDLSSGRHGRAVRPPEHLEGVRGAHAGAIPMAGGARRDVLDGVVDADWIPGTDALAVIRDAGGGRPWTVEFPVGNDGPRSPRRMVAAGLAGRESPGVFRRSGRRVRRGAGIDDNRDRQVGPEVDPCGGLVRHWIGLGAVGDRGLVHRGAPAADIGRTAVACRLARRSRTHGLQCA